MEALGDAGSSSSGGPHSQPPAKTPPPRRSKVAVACERCKKKKNKCPAERPTCSSCAKAAVECVYLRSEKESVLEDAKRRVTSLENECAPFGTLFNFLKTGDEADALEAINRLRAGEDTASVAEWAVGRQRDEGQAASTATLEKQQVPQQEQQPPLVLPPTLSQIPQLPANLPLSPRRDVGEILPARLRVLAHNPYAESWASISHTTAPPMPLAPSPGFGPTDLRSIAAAALEDTDSSEGDYVEMYTLSYGLAEVSDPRLEDVSANVWTKVPCSDKLFRQLLKNFFAWGYNWVTFLHADHFLNDMAAGRERFCSSALVNAILAYASHDFRTVAKRSDHWDPDSISYLFLAEARLLWDLELAKGPKPEQITTVQAGALLGICYSVDALDKVGLQFLRKAISMATEMGIFSASFYVDVGSYKLRAVASTTAWGLFCWQSAHALHYHEAPWLSKPPPRAFPPSEQAIEGPPPLGEVLVTYPRGSRRTSPLSSGSDLAFREACKLHRIANEISFRFFGDSSCPGSVASGNFCTGPEAASILLRLQAWFDELPMPLRPRRAVLPHHLRLHMQYQSLVACLTGSFEGVNLLLREELRHARASSTSYSVDVANQRPPAEPSVDKTPWMTSVACVETLVRVYYLCHGFDVFDPGLVVFLGFMGFRSLDEMTGPRSPTSIAFHPKAADAATFASDVARTSTRDGSSRQTVSSAPSLPVVDSESPVCTVVLCAGGLVDQGRSCSVAEALFFVMCDRMEAQGYLHLLREVDPAIVAAGTGDGDEGYGQRWQERRKAVAGQVRADWPIRLVNVCDSVEGLKLEHLVRPFAMGDEDGSGSGSDTMNTADGVS